MIVYKRKFRVPGDTIKDCWSFRTKCDKKYRDGKPCLNMQRSYRKRDKSKCPYPIDKPTMYIVSEMEDGTWRCSCPVWKFRRRACHHMDKARANPEEYEIAVEFTGRTTEILEKVFK